MIEEMDHRDRLLSVTELAEYLGVPVTTLYQWRYRREGPPGFRVGRHVRYRWSDVQEWIEAQIELQLAIANR
jgi:excisionase family DNA binding protein